MNMAIGDSLFAYTDGIPDAESIRGEFFGTDRLLAELGGKSFENVQNMGKHIIEQVGRFAGSQAQTDDMCVTLFGRTG